MAESVQTGKLSRQEMLEEYRRKKKEENERKVKKNAVGRGEISSKTVKSQSDKFKPKNEKISVSNKSKPSMQNTLNSKVKMTRGEQKENLTSSLTRSKLNANAKTPLKERISSLTLSAKKAMKASSYTMESELKKDYSSNRTLEKNMGKGLIEEKKKSNQQMTKRAIDINSNDKLRNGARKDRKDSFPLSKMDESRIEKESSTKNHINIKKNQKYTKSELYIQEKLNEVNKLVDLTFFDAAKALLSELKRDIKYKSILLSKAKYWILLNEISEKQPSSSSTSTIFGAETSKIKVHDSQDILKEGISHMKRGNNKIEKEEVEFLMEYITKRKIGESMRENKMSVFISSKNTESNQNMDLPNPPYQSQDHMKGNDQVKDSSYIEKNKGRTSNGFYQKSHYQSKQISTIRSDLDTDEVNNLSFPDNDKVIEKALPLKGRVAHLKSLFEQKCKGSKCTDPPLPPLHANNISNGTTPKKKNDMSVRKTSNGNRMEKYTPLSMKKTPKSRKTNSSILTPRTPSSVESKSQSIASCYITKTVEKSKSKMEEYAESKTYAAKGTNLEKVKNDDSPVKDAVERFLFSDNEDEDESNDKIHNNEHEKKIMIDKMTYKKEKRNAEQNDTVLLHHVENTFPRGTKENIRDHCTPTVGKYSQDSYGQSNTPFSMKNNESLDTPLSIQSELSSPGLNLSVRRESLPQNLLGSCSRVKHEKNTLDNKNDLCLSVEISNLSQEEKKEEKKQTDNANDDFLADLLSDSDCDSQHEQPKLTSPTDCASSSSNSNCSIIPPSVATPTCTVTVPKEAFENEPGKDTKIKRLGQAFTKSFSGITSSISNYRRRRSSAGSEVSSLFSLSPGSMKEDKELLRNDIMHSDKNETINASSGDKSQPSKVATPLHNSSNLKASFYPTNEKNPSPFLRPRDCEMTQELVIGKENKPSTIKRKRRTTKETESLMKEVQEYLKASSNPLMPSISKLEQSGDVNRKMCEESQKLDSVTMNSESSGLIERTMVNARGIITPVKRSARLSFSSNRKKKIESKTTIPEER